MMNIHFRSILQTFYDLQLDSKNILSDISLDLLYVEKNFMVESYEWIEYFTKKR